MCKQPSAPSPKTRAKNKNVKRAAPGKFKNSTKQEKNNKCTCFASDGIISSFYAFLALIPWFSTGSMVSLIPSFITYHYECICSKPQKNTNIHVGLTLLSGLKYVSTRDINGLDKLA
jgi:hypothetical protein